MPHTTNAKGPVTKDVILSTIIHGPVTEDTTSTVIAGSPIAKATIPTTNSSSLVIEPLLAASVLTVSFGGLVVKIFYM